MKKNFKKVLALAAAAVLTAGLLAGCGGNGGSSSDTSAASASSAAAASTSTASSASSAETAPATGEGKVLNFGIQMYGDGLIDPTNQINAAWNVMRYGIGEALTKFDDSMTPQPWLAESWETEDYTTWVIKLKDGVKFSDGDDMTASAVKASFDRMLAEGPNGSSTPEKYVPYETEITADDAAGTITFKLPEANINFMGNLAYPVCVVVDVEHTTDWNNGVIGTGPYMVQSFQDQVGYTMVKNPNYYEEVPFDTVKLVFMGDAAAKAYALQNGQVDLVENITNVSDIQVLQADDRFIVDIASGVRCGFAWMNQKGVLGNDVLRQAILMAIDYDTICASNTIGGLYTAGFSVLPSTLSYGYENLKNPYAYDPDAAIALLEENGIKDTDGDGWRELDGKMIDLKCVSYENRLLNDFSDAFAQYLAEVGIKVTADYGSSQDQWSKLVAFDYDLNNNNWTTVGTGDPTEYMANWYSKAEANYCGYVNEEYDKLYEDYKASTDIAERAQIMQEMQQILVDDAVAIIDGYYNSSMIYNKSKVGFAKIHTADYYWLTTEIVPAE